MSSSRPGVSLCRTDTLWVSLHPVRAAPQRAGAPGPEAHGSALAQTSSAAQPRAAKGAGPRASLPDSGLAGYPTER